MSIMGGGGTSYFYIGYLCVWAGYGWKIGVFGLEMGEKWV